MEKTIKLSFGWLSGIILIVSIYLFYSQVITLLYFFYALMILLLILSHILIFNNFKYKFFDILNNYNFNKINLGSKLFFIQAISCLLSNWFIFNLLEQSKLNIRTANVSMNLIPNNYYIVMSGILVNWIILLSILLGINFCKQYFKYPSNWFSLAKCLFPKSITQPRVWCYKFFLHTEGYAKLISLISVIALVTSVVFEIIIKKHNLLSFLSYPLIVSCLTILICYYLMKTINNNINFFSKNTAVDFIKLFIIIAVFVGFIMFFINQLILAQIPTNAMKHINSMFIEYFFNNIECNKNRIKILILSINILLTICSSYLLLDKINKHSVKTIYFISLIAPVICGFVFPKFINNLSSNFVNIIISSIIILILLIKYKNIYSYTELITCRVKLTSSIKNNNRIKGRLINIIQKTIYSYCYYLSIYYLITWLLPMHLLSIVSILFLLGLVMLLIKCIYPKYY